MLPREGGIEEEILDDVVGEDAKEDDYENSELAAREREGEGIAAVRGRRGGAQRFSLRSIKGSSAGSKLGQTVRTAQRPTHLLRPPQEIEEVKIGQNGGDGEVGVARPQVRR